MRMKIGEAKAHLSRLVAAAEAGEEVVIMRGDKPAVRLVPVARASETGEKPWMAHLGEYPDLFPEDIDWVAPLFTDDQYLEMERVKERRIAEGVKSDR